LVLGWKEINDTPHFYSLPQGERRIERISPSPYPSPARVERRRRKMKRFKQYPLTLTLSRKVRRKKVEGR
jgi:hypothetical protein